MARLRQQYPQNYVSSGNISTEFENVVRYLNSAEIGNKTVGELLAQLFDASGNFAGPIEIRKEEGGELQYRVGTYANPEDGWITFAEAEDLRGAPGMVVGEIGDPVFHSRADATATLNQTVFSYAHDSTDELVVYVNGVLKREGVLNDYVHDAAADTVTFNAGLNASDEVSIFKVRSSSASQFSRSDTFTAAPQAVFPFPHDADDVVLVYKNGILQREGALDDYTKNPDTDTVTFTSTVGANNLVTIMSVQDNTVLNTVTGFMMESAYVDSATGLIPYAKLKIADNDINQSKVNGLATHVSTAAHIIVSATSPLSPNTRQLWLDTSQSPNQLKFFDGVQWLRTSPESSLPTYTAANATQYIRVNGTGTALEYSNIDLSSVIPLSQKGAANGVSQLDSTGRVPLSQLPEAIATFSYYLERSGAIADNTYIVTRIFRQKIRISGIAVRLTSGTCNIQIAINGVATGSTYNASSTPVEVAIPTPIEVDSTSASRAIQVIVSSGSSTNGLDVVLSGSVMSS